MYKSRQNFSKANCVRAVRALDFLKEFIDPDTGEQKYMNQLVGPGTLPHYRWVPHDIAVGSPLHVRRDCDNFLLSSAANRRRLQIEKGLSWKWTWTMSHR